jgi:hypothetical protein
VTRVPFTPSNGTRHACAAPICPAGGSYTVYADSPTNAVACSFDTDTDYKHEL